MENNLRIRDILLAEEEEKARKVGFIKSIYRGAKAKVKRKIEKKVTGVKYKVRKVLHPIKATKLAYRQRKGDVKVRRGTGGVAAQARKKAEWEVKKYEQKKKFAKTGKID
jgi:hypothetical protein